ncbi:MAG: heme exporter protein CcmD [Pseudomonadota bacterium]|nr:heme exporter protein CcmD [Pseudomonadota bacterium]
MAALGPYAGFIIGAYAMALAVILALLAWVVLDHKRQRRMLAELEARGARRRSRGTTPI